MAYKAVIFDLFGTLVDTITYAELDGMLQELADVSGVGFEGFRRLWLETFEERASGMYPDGQTYFAALLWKLGKSATDSQLKETWEIRLDMFRSLLVPRPDALPTLEGLRDRGVKLGLITDCSWEVPHLWSSTSFVSYFTHPVFSCDVGLTKPDRRIFTLACRWLGVEPGDCLFVGDGGSMELTGAVAAGLDAVQIVVPGESSDSVVRYNSDVWEGSRITSLRMILTLLDRRK